MCGVCCARLFLACCGCQTIFLPVTDYTGGSHLALCVVRVGLRRHKHNYTSSQTSSHITNISPNITTHNTTNTTTQSPQTLPFTSPYTSLRCIKMVKANRSYFNLKLYKYVYQIKRWKQIIDIDGVGGVNWCESWLQHLQITLFAATSGYNYNIIIASSFPITSVLGVF